MTFSSLFIAYHLYFMKYRLNLSSSLTWNISVIQSSCDFRERSVELFQDVLIVRAAWFVSMLFQWKLLLEDTLHWEKSKRLVVWFKDDRGGRNAADFSTGLFSTFLRSCLIGSEEEGLSCSPFQIVGKYAARSAKKGSISYALLSVFSCSSYLLNLIVLSLYYLALRFFCLFNLLANFRLFELRLILVLLWFFEYWAKKKKVICKFNVLSASTSLLGFEDGMFLIWKKRKKLRRNWRDLNFYHVYALPFPQN